MTLPPALVIGVGTVTAAGAQTGGAVGASLHVTVTMDWPDSDADVAFTWYRHDIFCPATIPFGLLMFVVTDVGCDGALHVLSLNGPLTRLHR